MSGWMAVCFPDTSPRAPLHLRGRRSQGDCPTCIATPGLAGARHPHPRHRSDSMFLLLAPHSLLSFLTWGSQPHRRRLVLIVLPAWGPETQSQPLRVHLPLPGHQHSGGPCAGLHTLLSDHLCISSGLHYPLFLRDKRGSRGRVSWIILPKYVQVLFLSTWECDLLWKSAFAVLIT